MPNDVPAAEDGIAQLLLQQTAEMVADGTVQFCRRCLTREDRMFDHMQHAARSVMKNLNASHRATSTDMTIQQLTAMRANLAALWKDSAGFLRERGAWLWLKAAPEAQLVRKLALPPGASFAVLAIYFETHPPKVVANILIRLIQETGALLDQRLRQLCLPVKHVDDLREDRQVHDKSRGDGGVEHMDDRGEDSRSTWLSDQADERF